MTDTELLQASLTGNRSAYGQIVDRYKSLICAVAYGTTGDLRLSEDLAQETFVTAWRQLAEIRDLNKFRPWICGIARNLSLLSLRRGRRDVMARAEALERLPDQAASAPTPRECAVSNEEQALLWHAIERIPESFRMPLILYYREGQSVQRVAESLGLSNDAVKQRLVRGRRMLKDEVESFVERSLARTRPAQGFTLGVLSSLPRVAARTGVAGSGAAASARGASILGKLMAAVPVSGAKQAALACIVIVLAFAARMALHASGSDAATPSVKPRASRVAAVAEESQPLAAREEQPAVAVFKATPNPAPPGASALPAARPTSKRDELQARQVAPAGYPGTSWPGHPADVIKGIVYDPSGRGLGEAKVSAVRYGSGPIQIFECLTDAEGRYRLSVPPGQWSVKARKGRLGGEAGPEVWGQVITEGRDEVMTKSIRTEERGIICGHILDRETGLTVERGQVYTLHQSGDTLVASVGDGGRYELEGVKQYEQYLVAVCPGYERLVVITSNVLRNEAELDIRLARAGKVAGVVTDAAGRPVAHAWVGRDLLNTGNSMYHYEVCDAEGRFEYDGQPLDKRVRLTATYPCYGNVCGVDTGPEQDWAGVIPSKGGAAAPASIALQGEPVKEVRAYWRGSYPSAEGAVRGRVVAPDGRPVRDFRILVQWPHSFHEAGERPDMSIDCWTRGFCFTSDSGEFAVGVPSMRPGHAVRVVAAADGYGQGVRDVVEVHPIASLPPPESLVLRLEPPHELSVRVVEDGPGAEPVEGAEVSVADVPPRVDGTFRWDSVRMWRPTTLVTDREGWARFANLEIGEGTVVTQKEGHGKGRVEWRNGERTLSVVLSRACVVEGTVLDDLSSANGQPVTPGYVKLDRLPDGVYDSESKAVETFEAGIRAEHKGAFRIEGISPGYYRLTAHWWQQPDQQPVSYVDEFILEPGDALTAVYPDDPAYNNPARWLAEGSGDPKDEAIRRQLVGTWYHDVPLADGNIQRAIYYFGEDGRSTRMAFLEGRPPASSVPGYFKVYGGRLKMAEEDRSPLDTEIVFTDSDTLVLGWLTSEPPLKRAARPEEAVRQGEALLDGIRPASAALDYGTARRAASEASEPPGGGF